MVDKVGTIAIIAIVIIISLADVGTASYLYLGWPRWLVRHMERRRSDEVRRVLLELGFDEDRRQEIRSASAWRRLSERIRYRDLTDVERRTIDLLRPVFSAGTFRVGLRNTRQFPYFVDAFKGSLNPEFSDEAAALLVSYMGAIIPRVEMPAFSGVVGLKNGTPLLAYHVAKRLSLPCILHRGRTHYKFGTQGDVAELFDGCVSAGDVLLLVDDSSTGGRMALDCIEDVRSLHGEVPVFLMLFEPLGKDARGLLEGHGVRFLSILQMNNETVQRLSESG